MAINEHRCRGRHAGRWQTKRGQRQKDASGKFCDIDVSDLHADWTASERHLTWTSFLDLWNDRVSQGKQRRSEVQCPCPV